MIDKNKIKIGSIVACTTTEGINYQGRVIKKKYSDMCVLIETADISLTPWFARARDYSTYMSECGLNTLKEGRGKVVSLPDYNFIENSYSEWVVKILGECGAIVKYRQRMGFTDE